MNGRSIWHGARPRRALLAAAVRRAAHLRLAAALLTAAALLAGAGCGRHETHAKEQATVAVALERLAARPEASVVEAVGTLRAGREATISGKVMGTVTEIRKRAGDPVREGEILLVVDSRDVAGQVLQAEGALAQARAAATLAETNLHRFEQLHERGAASSLELDQARYHYETALGAVKQAEGAVATASSYQAYARIPAPFAGRVVDRLCEEGDLAAPGRPLMKIEDAGRLRLHASLEASRAAAAEVGKAVEVIVPLPEEATSPAGGAPRRERRIPGTITEVTPAADPATRSVLVKIDLAEDPSLRAGLFGRARIPSGERLALRVPASAIVRRGGVTGVFVNEGGQAAFRMVELASGSAGGGAGSGASGSAGGPGGEAGPGLEVLSGLSAGDAVVLDPPATLRIGDRLEVRS